MAVALDTISTEPSARPHGRRTQRLAPGIHVEGWRGPNGELVVVPIGSNGRIAVPAPYYVTDPADLLRIREDFDRGLLPGQTETPSRARDVAEPLTVLR